MISLQIFLLRLIFGLLALLPVRPMGAIGAGLGRLACRLDRRHRLIAERNLARIYPDHERPWRQKMARESFAELGRTLFELPTVFMRSKAALLGRVEIVGREHLEAALREGKGLFLAAAHHSNWELGGLLVSALDHPSSVIYREMKNPPAERFLKERRERFGAEFHSRLDGVRWLPRALKDGRIISLMIDQHISHGVPVPFLGHLGNTTTLPAPFVAKQQTPLVGVALVRHGADFRFTLRFWPIAAPRATGDREQDAVSLMQAINDSFAPTIHARPELWLWSHRRWLILEQNRDMMEVVHGAP